MSYSPEMEEIFHDVLLMKLHTANVQRFYYISLKNFTMNSNLNFAFNNQSGKNYL